MVRTLRDPDEWKLALLNEIARIATALEEIQCSHEFLLQNQEAQFRFKSKTSIEDSQ